jgi:hypothetical protein
MKHSALEYTYHDLRELRFISEKKLMSVTYIMSNALHLLMKHVYIISSPTCSNTIFIATFTHLYIHICFTYYVTIFDVCI